MKHFLSYGADGQLIGIHTHRHAGTGLNGWPANCNMHNPNCKHEATKYFRSTLIGKNGVVDFVKYECPCPPTADSCACVGNVYAKSRVENGELVAKLEGAFTIAGAPLDDNSTIKRPPGVPVKLRIVAAGIPDGAKVSVTQRGTVAIIEGPLELSFTSGATPEFDVYPPAQGLTGLLGAVGLYMAPIGLYVTGWGA